MAKNITNYVRSCVDDFKHFVGIDSFPAFDVKSKEITIEKSLKQGFDATAAVQSASAMTSIYAVNIWLPGICLAIILVCYGLYSLEKKYVEIVKHNEARRAGK